MRVPAMLLLLSLAVPAMAADRAPANAPSARVADCPRTTSYLADTHGLYRGAPLAPRKLTELPPATGYMAVYRQVGGCESPLTMADYRKTHGGHGMR